jgi:hypothetical protein
MPPFVFSSCSTRSTINRSAIGRSSWRKTSGCARGMQLSDVATRLARPIGTCMQRALAARKVSFFLARSRGARDVHGKFRILDKLLGMDSVRVLATPKRHLSERGSCFAWIVPLGDRLTVGQRILAPLIKVRILVPQLGRVRQRARDSHAQNKNPRTSNWPHRLAVRTPASHVGNTGSIPVGVTTFPSENGNLASIVSDESETHPRLVRAAKKSGGSGGRGSPMRRRSVWPRAMYRLGAKDNRSNPPHKCATRLRAGAPISRSRSRWRVRGSSWD